VTGRADNAVEIFKAAAGEYDALRRRAVPCFDPFYDHVVRMLTNQPKRILDLGAGTGMLTRLVLEAHPEARAVVVDGAAEMLTQAEAALGDRIEATHVQDLADPLPDGPFDAVVSAFAIHHLDDPGKADLYARIFHVLAPGGPFVNGEQVAGPTPALDAMYRRWHEEDSRALGSDDAEWAATEQRMRLDISAPVEPQLQWLRDAGFVDVDCPWRSGRFAVLAGRRP
jgi:tRNA (cmo5U34)-methyltransferase